ncbi:hypothetical protein COO60DRAFT_1543014 [Scenedesmus sp. NREL 46B-D3]|nr:hypothetical protein COO60DRAFT_1543014 [Scenedesmus sp. NREL 46B-D3]
MARGTADVRRRSFSCAALALLCLAAMRVFATAYFTPAIGAAAALVQGAAVAGKCIDRALLASGVGVVPLCSTIQLHECCSAAAAVAGSHGGEHVEVEGSFDNWSTRQPLQRTGRDFTVIKLLPPGVYQYKFIVDGDWKYDPNQPAMFDEIGNVNNVIEVQEYVPENLENVSGFDPPPSPPASYNSPHPVAEDYAKEPPGMPPHLQLTLLNVPSSAEGDASLPRPQHVILNHIYIQRGQTMNALVVGTTHRYKGKYITSVLYKPRSSSSASARQHASHNQPFRQDN